MKSCFKLTKILLLLFVLTSCQTTKKVARNEIAWKNIERGIDEFSYKNRAKKIMFDVVRIDLTEKGLDIFNLKSKNEWQKSTTVKKFAKKTGAAVAINTSPFYTKNRILTHSKSKPCGIIVAESEVLIPPNEKYCAVAFYKNDDGWEAKIFDNQNDVLAGKMPLEACGGFWTILRDGKIRQFENIKDVRSAVATAASGKTLYLFAGKNLTYMECAEIFLRLGAEVAMQFDGGSSTQLVVNGKNKIPQSIQRQVCAVLGISVK